MGGWVVGFGGMRWCSVFWLCFFFGGGGGGWRPPPNCSLIEAKNGKGGDKFGSVFFLQEGGSRRSFVLHPPKKKAPPSLRAHTHTYQPTPSTKPTKQAPPSPRSRRSSRRRATAGAWAGSAPDLPRTASGRRCATSWTGPPRWVGGWHHFSGGVVWVNRWWRGDGIICVCGGGGNSVIYL